MPVPRIVELGLPYRGSTALIIAPTLDVWSVLTARRMTLLAVCGALGYLATTLVMGGAWGAAAAFGLILVTT